MANLCWRDLAGVRISNIVSCRILAGNLGGVAADGARVQNFIGIDDGTRNLGDYATKQTRNGEPACELPERGKKLPRRSRP